MISFLKSHKGIIIIDQAIFSGTSFVMTILLARLLTIDDFGKYSGYILAIYLVVSGTSAFIIQPFQVFQAKEKDIKVYTSFTFCLQFVTIGLLIILTLVFQNYLPGYFPTMLLGYSAGFLIHDFGRKLLLALNRPMQTLLYDSATSSILLFAVLFANFNSYSNLNSLFALLSYSYIVSFVMLVAFIKPFYFNIKSFSEHIRNHFREGKWLFLTAVAQWWSSNLFVVASGLYLGTAALGALRLVQSLMGILNVLLQTFENYVLPQTALKINKDISVAISYVVLVSKKAGFLFLPILIFIFIFAEEIIVLAGGIEYKQYAFALRGITILYVLIFFNQPVRLMMRSLLLNQHFFFGYLISLAFAILFAHNLLSSYGLYGAIAGLAVSQLLLIFYWTIILQKKKIYLWKLFISS